MPDDVVFEQWGDSGAAPDRARTRITVRPQDAGGDVAFERWGGEGQSTLSDVGKSTLAGLEEGAISLAGTGGDVWNMIDRALSAHGIDENSRNVVRRVLPLIPGNFLGAIVQGPSSQQVRDIVQPVTGDIYQPQTRAGRYARTAASFIPGALIPGMGAGGVAARMLKFGVLPGLASEAAGEATSGTAAEPYARGGAALATGGGIAAVTRPQTAASSVRGAIPSNITAQQLRDAETLFQDAQRAGQPLTRAEAVQYVTQGATRLGDLQRVAEGQGAMRDFFASRPAGNEAALNQAANTIAPPSFQPSTIGPAVGRAAESTLDDTRAAINRTTKPIYDAATQQRIDPQLFATIRNDPVFVEGVKRVRDDPIIGPTLRGLPDDSVAVIDAVKKQLDETGRNLRDPLSGTARNNYAASIVDQGNKRIVQAADLGTGSVPSAGIAGTYEAARGIQAQLRERYLEPLMRGPIGRLADKDITTQRAIAALFPANPLPNSAGEIAVAVSALAKRNPMAARQLVRAHVEMVFNEAAQNLTSGPNQFGGARFAAGLRGNQQQAANLEAAIRALPNGNQIWPGFDRFLQILEAQGTRQRIGSQTAFNQEVLADLRRGTPLAEAGTAAATVGVKLPAKIKDTLERWRLGRGVDEIAALLTSPEAGQRFAQIARMPVGGDEAMRLFGRLVLLARQGASQPSSRTNNPGNQ